MSMIEAILGGHGATAPARCRPWIKPAIRETHDWLLSERAEMLALAGVPVFPIEPDGKAPSMYDVLIDSKPLAEVRKEVEERLWLAGSDINLAAAEVELAGVVGREVILRDLLQGLYSEPRFTTWPTRSFSLVQRQIRPFCEIGHKVVADGKIARLSALSCFQPLQLLGDLCFQTLLPLRRQAVPPGSRGEDPIDIARRRQMIPPLACLGFRLFPDAHRCSERASAIWAFFLRPVPRPGLC